MQLSERVTHSQCKGPEVHVCLARLRMSKETQEAGEGWERAMEVVRSGQILDM